MSSGRTQLNRVSVCDQSATGIMRSAQYRDTAAYGCTSHIPAKKETRSLVIAMPAKPTVVSTDIFWHGPRLRFRSPHIKLTSHIPQAWGEKKIQSKRNICLSSFRYKRMHPVLGIHFTKRGYIIDCSVTVVEITRKWLSLTICIFIRMCYPP